MIGTFLADAPAKITASDAMTKIVKCNYNGIY